jgi:hypothetical protein
MPGDQEHRTSCRSHNLYGDVIHLLHRRSSRWVIESDFVLLVRP